jgi:uncharacterized membrane protein
MKRYINFFNIFFSIGFPFFVYWGLTYFQPRVITVTLGLILLIRFFSSLKLKNLSILYIKTPFILAIIFIFFFLIQLNQKQSLLFVPSLINLGLLIVFTQSLWKPPTMIEFFAKMQIDDLDEQEIIYCRTVTKIWIFFFIINGCIALLLALYGSLTLWTLYNGFIAYIAIGCLFSIEWIYRHLKFPRFKGILSETIIIKVLIKILKNGK